MSSMAIKRNRGPSVPYLRACHLPAKWRGLWAALGSMCSSPPTSLPICKPSSKSTPAAAHAASLCTQTGYVSGLLQQSTKAVQQKSSYYWATTDLTFGQNLWRPQFNMFCVRICICGCTAAWAWVWPLPKSRSGDKNRWSYAPPPSIRLWVVSSDNLLLRVLTRSLTWRFMASELIFKWFMFLHCESSFTSFLFAWRATWLLHKR